MKTVMKSRLVVVALALAGCSAEADVEKAGPSTASRLVGISEFKTVTHDARALELLALDGAGKQLAKLTVQVDPIAQSRKIRIEGFANGDGTVPWMENEGHLEPLTLIATAVDPFNVMLADPVVLDHLATYALTFDPTAGALDMTSGEAAYHDSCSPSACAAGGNSGCHQAQDTFCDGDTFDIQWACCNSPQQLVQRVCDPYSSRWNCSYSQVGCSMDFGGNGCCVAWQGGAGSWSLGPCPF